MKRLSVILAMTLALAGCSTAPTSTPTDGSTGNSDTQHASPTTVGGGLDVVGPSAPIRLVFIHHSTGEAWLNDEHGGLAVALAENNYFVSDTNYGWGAVDPLLGGPIGDYTDIGNWWNWFLGPSSDTVMNAVYAESGQSFEYTRLFDDPGGENQIVVFKSCFPNSNIGGNPQDPPTVGVNPLAGAGLDNLTVGNAKALYLDLLDYFAAHPDKLFVMVTAPPLLASDTSPEAAANARAFNTWLVEHWLDGYQGSNVAVFDFYNILTSNGGDPNTNDLGATTGNHHRYVDGQIEYVTDQGSNTSAYAADGDSHPTAAGDQKATGEFVTLLNLFYQRWQDGE